jgi:ADP-ribose pyrophosphatase YjhB (NUDIX family)
MSDIVLQVGVKVFLKNKENKYLLLRRNSEKYPEIKPSYDLVGGRINPGSSLLDNLEREVFEETKLKMTSTPKLVGAQDILMKDRHVVRLTYVGTVEDKDPVIDDESLEYKWFSLSELQNMNEDLDNFVIDILKDVSEIL